MYQWIIVHHLYSSRCDLNLVKTWSVIVLSIAHYQNFHGLHDFPCCYSQVESVPFSQAVWVDLIESVCLMDHLRVPIVIALKQTYYMFSSHLLLGFILFSIFYLDVCGDALRNSHVWIFDPATLSGGTHFRSYWKNVDQLAISHL